MSDHGLDAMDASIDAIEAAMKPFLTVPLNTLASELPPAEKAKLYANYGYAVTSLVYSAFMAMVPPGLILSVSVSVANCFGDAVYLRTQGINAREHPVKKEIVSGCGAGRCGGVPWPFPVVDLALSVTFQDRIKTYFEKIEAVTGTGAWLMP
jgi:hypothetical protein